MTQNHVVDRGDLRKYRTEIPNSVDDMDLSVYAFRLYVHLKRVAGDSGKCWQSTDTLAKSCKMGKGMVGKAKDELLARGLISITEHKLERGGRAAHHITIMDIWLENFIKFSGIEPSSCGELPSSQSELPSSCGELKKEPIKKEPIKKDITAEFLTTWKALFPTKPQPKPATIQEKLKTRLKNTDFAENWKAALERGAKTRILHTESWFSLTFFLRNDENFQKVLDGWMDWKDGGTPAVIPTPTARNADGSFNL